jgi:hypothetical protein
VVVGIRALLALRDRREAQARPALGSGWPGRLRVVEWVGMTVVVHVTYRGPRGLVSAFAGMLEAEGLTLAWQPPTELPGVGEVLLTVVEPTITGFAVDAMVASVRAAVASFEERFPNDGLVDL